MLYARVVLEPILGQIFAIAGVLKASVRHLCHEGNMAVNPHSPEVKTLGETHRPTMVFRPHTRGQAIQHVVGHAKSFLLLREGLDRDDGTKDFVLNGIIALLQARHNGGLHEVACAALPGTTGLDHSVIGQRSQNPHDSIHLVVVVQRAIENVGVGGHSGGDVTRYPFLELRDEVIVNRFVDEHTRGRGAVLASVEESGSSNAFDCGGNIRIGKDHHRCFATEFQSEPS